MKLRNYLQTFVLCIAVTLFAGALYDDLLYENEQLEDKLELQTDNVKYMQGELDKLYNRLETLRRAKLLLEEDNAHYAKSIDELVADNEDLREELEAEIAASEMFGDIDDLPPDMGEGFMTDEEIEAVNAEIDSDWDFGATEHGPKTAAETAMDDWFMSQDEWMLRLMIEQGALPFMDPVEAKIFSHGVMAIPHLVDTSPLNF